MARHYLFMAVTRSVARRGRFSRAIPITVRWSA